MSSAESTPELSESCQVHFIIHLTYHVPRNNRNGHGRAKTTVKDEKKKETTFNMQMDNYVEFLRALLKLFGEEKYEVSASSAYRIQYCLTTVFVPHLYLIYV